MRLTAKEGHLTTAKQMQTQGFRLTQRLLFVFHLYLLLSKCG
jgi:hypothetical protein